jgi:predicted O-methyltransferase YrrM
LLLARSPEQAGLIGGWTIFDREGRRAPGTTWGNFSPPLSASVTLTQLNSAHFHCSLFISRGSPRISRGGIAPDIRLSLCHSPLRFMNAISCFGKLLIPVLMIHATCEAGAQQRRDENSRIWSLPHEPPQPRNDAEARILAVINAMTADRDQRYLSVSPEDGRLFRQLTEAIGARRVVEIGTSTGYSGLWFALALRTTGGKLITHEIDGERAEKARKNFKEAGVEGLVTLIEGDAHELVKQHTEPIDILFLDADKEGYLDYLKKLLPLIRPGGLVLAHNMRRPAPDPRFIEAITTDPNLDTSFVLMEGAGVAITLKKR